MNLNTRAKAYLTRIYGDRRPILVNPEGHEEGFYHEVRPDNGKPYLTQLAYIAKPPHAVAFLVDVTGDTDRILCNLGD